jgi:alanyl-tRNA synthetase
MTLRLYYQDSTLCEFTARIIQRSKTERGPAVQLDQTAFYPTSGGQPHDTGTLGGIPVMDVWEDEAGRIWHGLEGLLDDEEVTGLVVWTRRFDHMQQHTGQHILSAAFLDALNANTIGFHMGSEASTIDLDIPVITKDDIRNVEETGNRVVWENRPVKVQIIGDNELDSIPFRKPPQVRGEIRVIWVEGYDASACGGTHVRSTGEIGVIKITATERYKSGVRVTFLCGQRALKDYQRVLENIQHASAGLSIHQDELGETIARMQEENKSTCRELNKIRKDLMAYKAKHLWEETPETEGIRKVIAYRDDLSYDDVRAIAENLRRYPKTLILLAATEEQTIRLLCTRSDDLPEVNVAGILKRAVESLGGRGGGSPSIAQGGAPMAEHKAVLEVLRKTILNNL